MTVSRARSLRTCRGVAPMARSSAISRCRCWTKRVIMPASTRAATNSAMPPSEPLIAISRMLDSEESRNSARPRVVAGQDDELLGQDLVERRRRRSPRPHPC